MISSCEVPLIVRRSPGHKEGSILTPRKRRRTTPWRRISVQRSTLGSSQRSRAVGVDGGTLRSVLVKATLELRGADFAARESHGLENPLVTKGRLLIGLFGGGCFLDRAFAARILMRLRHSQLAHLHRNVREPMSRRLIDYRTIQGQVQCMLGHRYSVSYHAAWF